MCSSDAPPPWGDLLGTSSPGAAGGGGGGGGEGEEERVGVVGDEWLVSCLREGVSGAFAARNTSTESFLVSVSLSWFHVERELF